MKKISRSEKETFDLAKFFAQSLKKGQTLGLIGELGAGKTSFTKGLAAGLGIKKLVSSPTFVLMRVYEANHPAIDRLVHVDAYRIKKASSLLEIGLDDYIEDERTLVVIEWADLVLQLLPEKANVIIFTHSAAGRTINFPSSKTPATPVQKPRRRSLNQRDSKR